MSRDASQAWPGVESGPRFLFIATELPDRDIDPAARALGSVLDDLARQGQVAILGWPTRRLFPDEPPLGAPHPGDAERFVSHLFRGTIDQLPLDAERDWSALVDLNMRLASAAAELHVAGDLVWVHDHRLMLLPGLIRARSPAARIGFFFDRAFPSSDVVRELPWSRSLVLGVLAADELGFATPASRDRFVAAAVELTAATPSDGGLRLGEHPIHIGVYPTGIDAASITAATESDEACAEVERLRAAHPGRTFIVAFDQIDATRGVPRRLRALRRLLTEDRALAERLHVIEVILPSGDGDDPRSKLRLEVAEELARLAPAGFPRGSSVIELREHPGSRSTLAALYRVADVLVATPMLDALGLRAMEYVAARTDGDGAIVLDDRIDDGGTLRGAIRVNPLATSEQVAALRQALTLPPPERQQRMTELREAVAQRQATACAAGFLDALAGFRAPIPTVEIPGLVALRRARRRVLLLDYDGALMPFALTPAEAGPDRGVLSLLLRLAATTGTDVHVVSGRKREDLERWLGAIPISLHAEHGYWSRLAATATWQAHGPPSVPWLDAVRRRFDVTAAAAPGALVESKTTGLALHYRRVAQARIEAELAMLRRWLVAELPVDAEVVDGSMVLEVRLRTVNAASIVRRVLPDISADVVVVAIGAARPAEDLFEALREPAVTIRVGAGSSAARLRLADTVQVRQLLDYLADDRGRASARTP